MLRHLMLLVSCACLASACVPNKMYRPGEKPGENRPDKNFFSYEQLETRQFEPAEVNSHDEWRYRLGFIEFDDRGEMFKRAQLRRVVEEIAKAKADAQSHASKRAVVAVFVHGWKNNASQSSGNVWGFRQVLAGLAKQYQNAPVVGVYIGWRGAVLSPPILKEFTIYDRMRKSQNLTGAHLVEALQKIMQAAKGPEYADPEPSTATLLIGHSFGGAVLETSLTQTVLGLAVKAKATGMPIRWPANLIMFVNEAQEATRSFQLIEALRENVPPRDLPVPGEALPRPAGCLPPADSTQTDAQQDRLPDAPAIVSISSTADAATKVAFTFANSVRRPFNSLRSYDEEDPNFLGFSRQTPMFLHTTAHMQEFHSHLIGRCHCSKPLTPEGGCENPDDLRCEEPAVELARKACKVNVETTLGDTTYLIVEKPEAKNRTPYWVLHMPPTIVPDHSTIFTPVFRNFIITLLNRSLIQVGP